MLIDLSRCPKCNGPSDNGHDREVPPNPYYCTKCMAEPTTEDSSAVEPGQEPVAWSHINGTSDTKWHPPQRKPLTEVDLRALYDRHAAYQEEGPEASGWWEFARAVEQAHGIKE